MKFSFPIILSMCILCGLSFAEDSVTPAVIDTVSTKADSVQANPAVAEADTVKKDTVATLADTIKIDTVTKVDSVKKDSAVAVKDTVKQAPVTAKVDSVKKDSVTAKTDTIKTDTVAKVDSVKKDSATVKTAQKYLHVLTNPFTADIYVNDNKPDFASNPDYVSPAFIKVPGSTPTVQITLFQRDYADTTINVTLSQKDTSYLIVALRQSSDPDLTEMQDKELAHRSRRNLGHHLLIASSVPFIASAISAYVTHKYIESANDEKTHVQNSLIRSGDKYEQHVKNYRNDRDNARTAKKVGAVTLGTGLALMTVGIILSF